MFFFLSALTASGQVMLTEEELRRPLQPETVEGGPLKMVFAATELSVDTLREDGAPASRSFVFTNKSGGPLAITSVRTGCGCTTARFEPAVVPVDGKGVITLTFNPANRAGEVSERAFVYTGLSAGRPTGVLLLRGVVLPASDLWKTYRYRAGALCMARREVSFNAGDGPSEERVMCANSGRTPLTISALPGSLPPYMSLRTEPEVIMPGETADLVLTVSPAEIPASRRGRTFKVSIILQGPACAPSQRTVIVTIGSEHNKK